MSWRRGVWAMLVLVLSGCAPARGPGVESGTPGAQYREGSEYVVPTLLGVMQRSVAATQGTTYYFNTDRSRVCYGFSLPGTWEPGREPASLRRVDNRGVVGVLLLDVRELGGSVDDAIRQAGERSGRLYATADGPIPWTLTPYPRIPGAWLWSSTATLTMPDRPGATGRVMPRWYVPVDQRWIAQFSIGTPDDLDRERFVDDVIRSLTTTREPRCYEQRLRELGGIRPR